MHPVSVSALAKACFVVGLSAALAACGGSSSPTTASVGSDTANQNNVVTIALSEPGTVQKAPGPNLVTLEGEWRSWEDQPSAISYDSSVDGLLIPPPTGGLTVGMRAFDQPLTEGQRYQLSVTSSDPNAAVILFLRNASGAVIDITDVDNGSTAKWIAASSNNPLRFDAPAGVVGFFVQVQSAWEAQAAAAVAANLNSEALALNTPATPVADAPSSEEQPAPVAQPVEQPAPVAAPSEPVAAPSEPVAAVPPSLAIESSTGDFRPAGYNTVFFAEEFDGDNLDRSKWCTRMPWGNGAPLQVADSGCTTVSGLGYGDFANAEEQQRFRDFNTNGEAMHVVSNGTIKLRGTKTLSHYWTSYEAGALRSKVTFKPSEGKSYYVTSRVYMPNVLGTLPTLFLNPSAGADGTLQWPPEIDIFEGALNGDLENEYSVTLHAQVGGAQTASGATEWFYADQGLNTAWGIYADTASMRNRWVEIGVEWAVDGICYFVDGLKAGCENYRWVTNDGTPANPATIIAYLAIGGTWAGRNGINDAQIPTQMEIDHIRVYEGSGVLSAALGLSRAAVSNTPAPAPIANSGNSGGGNNNGGNNSGGGDSQVTPVNNPGSDGVPAGYSMLFNDEFDGSELNRRIWCTRMPWGNGAPLQVPDSDGSCTTVSGLGYGDFANIDENQRFRDFNTLGEKLHDVSNGTLKIRATKTAAHFYTSYEAGALRSKQVFKPENGSSYYVTTRVKLPNILGVWPAFFLNPSSLNDQVQWPPEIDIFEAPINGDAENEFSIVQHAQADGQQTASGGTEFTYSAPGYNTTWGFHVSADSLRNRWLEIGAEWNESGVCYFINNVKTACENYRWVANDGAPGHPATVIMYMAVGGPWAGRNGIDAAKFPVQMEVDYVRVYKR